MWTEGLVFGVGIAIGVVIVLFLYKMYKNQTIAESQKTKDKSKLEYIVSEQTYIETVTVKDLTDWFRENRDQFTEDIKMIIAMPTVEVMKGLGCIEGKELDLNSTILQFFYDEKTGMHLKSRLVNYENINSNLQARLLEEDGLIVVKN